jgi:polyisoprenoid-binding protein YceI
MTSTRRPLIRPCTLAVTAVVAMVDATNAAHAEPARYELDPEHLTIAFLVEHLGYAKALGKFLSARGGYTFDAETGELSDVRVTVATMSVDTDHEARDRHLRSDDFLESEAHPEMTFTANGARRTGERTFEIDGELTLLGVSRPLVLEAVWNKSAPYPIPPRTEVMGVSARGRLERSAFGMSYGVADGLVGDEVEIVIELEARRSEGNR